MILKQKRETFNVVTEEGYLIHGDISNMKDAIEAAERFDKSGYSPITVGGSAKELRLQKVTTFTYVEMLDWVRKL